jgi:hypothetical protein
MNELPRMSAGSAASRSDLVDSEPAEDRRLAPPGLEVGSHSTARPPALRGWAARFEPYWSSPWPTFAALLLLDLALIAAFFRPFVTGPGALVYGDLGAVYTYGGVQERWIVTASVYQALEQALAQVAPWPSVQNAVYLSTFVLPSLGIYWFLELFTRHKPVAGGLALLLGTPLNPVFYGDFIQGGQEYGLWILFSFLGLRFLCAGLLDRHIRPWEPALAGVLFGLASSQTFGQTGMATGAVFLTGPIVVGILAYDWIRARDTPARNRTVAGIGWFLVAYLALLVPLLATDFVQANGVLGTAAQTAAISAKTFGNIAYTFRPYGPASAIFAVPPTPTEAGYTTPLSGAWALVVGLSLVGGLATFLTSRGPRRWLTAVFLASFLGFALYILGLSSGALLPLYTRVPPLDLFDGPDLLVYGEFLSLPFLLLVAVDWVVRPATWVPLRRAWRVISPPRTLRPWTPDSPAARARRPRWGLRTRAALVVIVLLALSLASAWPVLVNLNAKVDANPSIAPNSPFAASTALDALRTWYSGALPVLSGYVLPLPNDGHGYASVQGVIPVQRLWVIPLYSNDLVGGYNASAYVAVMGSLENGSVALWASQIGTAGVQYVVLTPLEVSVAIAPSYLTGAPAPLPYALLASWFLASPEFSEVYDSSGVLVFLNRAYVAPESPLPGVLAFSTGAPVGPSGSEPALAAGGFTSWDIWPPARVAIEPNGSAAINVNFSASPDYVVLWAPLKPPFPSGGGSGGPEISLDPVYHRFDYSFNDTVAIPGNARLQAYIAWYNTTDPASLFAWFATSSIGVFYTGTANVSGTFEAPPSTAAARVVFTAFPDGPGPAVDLLAAPASASATIAPLDLSTDAAAEMSVAAALGSDARIANGTLPLLYPLGVSAPLGSYSGITLVSFGAAEEFDPNQSFAFAVPLIPSRFPDLPALGSGATGSLDVQGYSNVSAPGATVAWRLDGSTRFDHLPSGGFSATFDVPAGDIGQAGTLNFSESVTLSLLAVVVVPPAAGGAGDPGSAAIALNLPIGSDSLATGSAGPELTARTTPQLGSSTSVSAFDLVPLPMAGLVLAGAVVIPWAGGRRRPSANSRTVARETNAR